MRSGSPWQNSARCWRQTCSTVIFGAEPGPALTKIVVSVATVLRRLQPVGRTEANLRCRNRCSGVPG